MKKLKELAVDYGFAGNVSAMIRYSCFTAMPKVLKKIKPPHAQT
jgi:hypothetical protein